jgi:hypothetical protein
MTPGLARRFERLESARARVLALLEAVDPDALQRAPAPGRWSALQLLHHVVVSEALTIGYVRKKMLAGASLPRAGLASRLRLVAVQATLASPLRISAPAAVASVPERVDPDELLARWRAVREELRQLLEGFPPELLDRRVFRHPIAGGLSLEHAVGTLGAHFDHHARQIERALRRPPDQGRAGLPLESP